MAYSKDYFDLQLKFANKIAQLTDTELSEVLLAYTSFYKSFNIPGWNFQVQNPSWQKYINMLKASGNTADVTYKFYLDSLKDTPINKNQFGCFSYEVDSDEEGDYVQIHFKNADDPVPGALSKERVSTRIDELTKMFTDIKENHPNVNRVFGFSWLYNLDAYKRLFPANFTHKAKKITDWFKSTALWGQFLDSAGEVKPDLATKFISSIRQAQSLPELLASFPYSMLEPEGKTSDFYRFYHVA